MICEYDEGVVYDCLVWGTQCGVMFYEEVWGYKYERESVKWNG